MLRFAWSTEYFPLTLSLPPSWRAKAPLRRDGGRERESRFRIGNWWLADGCWANSGPVVIEMQWTILPLPRGEGRGEGELSVSNPAVRPVIRKYRAGTRRYYLLPSQKGNAQTIYGSPMMGVESMLEVPPERRCSPVTA